MSDEPEIGPRRTKVAAYHHTGDRFAGRRVVTIGGGTGTFALLSHLKKYPLNISAIVTMSDSGGSSRRLMDEFRRQLPLGDLRMSLVAWPITARYGVKYLCTVLSSLKMQTPRSEV